ncbi:MAG: hypothetical protein AAF125_18905, partial [Chloroflexota bacterium]
GDGVALAAARTFVDGAARLTRTGAPTGNGDCLVAAARATTAARSVTGAALGGTVAICAVGKLLICLS